MPGGHGLPPTLASCTKGWETHLVVCCPRGFCARGSETNRETPTGVGRPHHHHHQAVGHAELNPIPTSWLETSDEALLSESRLQSAGDRAYLTGGWRGSMRGLQQGEGAQCWHFDLSGGGGGTGPIISPYQLP